MAKRIFSREFKFEAVRSVKETTSPPGLGTVEKTPTSGKRCCRRSFLSVSRNSYFTILHSRSSSSVLQSMHSVAMKMS